MKFARYLDDTQTPEWKRAYIDYRGLKKCITAIRKSHEDLAESSSEGEELHGAAASPQTTNGLPQRLVRESPSEQTPIDPSLLHESTSKHRQFPLVPRISIGPSLEGGKNLESLREEPESSSVPFETSLMQRPSDAPPKDESRTLKPPSQHAISLDPRVLDSSASTSSQTGRCLLATQSFSGEPTAEINSTAVNGVGYAKSLVSRGKRRTSLSFRYSIDRSTSNPMERLPLNELLRQLDPIEKAFFTALDDQLDKVDSFYSVRETELMARTKVLHEQLDELKDHKELIKSVHSQHTSTWTTSLGNIKKQLRINHMPAVVPIVGDRELGSAGDLRHRRPEPECLEKEKIRRDGSIDTDVERSDGEEKHHLPVRHVELSTDPEDYLLAKKKLKKAILEHYRGLEVLENYRILNLTGFRKALKKFEKSTKIRAQRQYMSEKVERASFGSGKNVQEMMIDMETLYAARFSRGDRKLARTRLRAGFHFTSHHYCVFRSGILLGLALPAFVSGLYASFQQTTRDAMPAWNALLFMYGVVFIPVLFSLLVGLNLLVWARARINYVFIFELDTRTRLDYREYHEIPSILLAALCWAFWLSFHRIGSPHILPQYWLLVWLGLSGLVILEPLPLFHKSSRYWLVRNTAKLLISGTRRVEFTDFWMGDQFCSLVFTLSNLYFFACVYARNFDEGWSKCGVSGSPQWPAMFVLASLPLLCRFVQSGKRYSDSGLVTHLINGGKYFSGIISNIFFYLWRQKGSKDHDSIFALWILFNTIYSVYASTWDLLMDWSVLRLHARFPLLREELIYHDAIPLYYFAIITNVLIRFIWVIYIPHNGPSMYLRTFIGALLEALRRWQWNFYRLENEHLGNVDQYRVTREVPLPYSFDHTHVEDADNGDDDDDKALELVAARVREERQSRIIEAAAGRKAKKAH